MEIPYANLQMTHWNPGAEMPLVLPVHLICNTSDDDIYANIRENSAPADREWMKLADANERVAVLCGSGPSLADTLEEVREWKANGAVIFAMNGAAKFLNDNGILADYQVLIDAREQTADLIGPAKEHLFASQVHPECFRRMPTAKLWHLQVEGIEDYFPQDVTRGYFLVGGAASVGNTATCLAYAMGFRNLQIYGYDSSHRDGKGHAFSQPMNDGDPCAVVQFNGKEYTASLTMKLQAEKFWETSRALMNMGCNIEVHGSGLLPDMFNAPQLSEVEKYKTMWDMMVYREYSPGEETAQLFVDVVEPRGVVGDFGCGTGRGGLAIKNKTGCEVILIDFAPNCLDPQARPLPFVEWDLSKPKIPVIVDHGYCCDVMEHIPPEQVEGVISNVMAACSHGCFFQISTTDDNTGVLIGQRLHLTVHGFDWWKSVFERLGYAVTWSEDKGEIVQFYVRKNENL